MASAQRREFSLYIDTLPDALEPERFYGREALNQPYCFEIEVFGDDPDLDLQTLVNRPAYLEFGREGEGVHGVIQDITDRSHTPGECHYHISLVPRLQALAHYAPRRVFCDMNVPEILQKLLEAHGLGADDYRFALDRGIYPPRIVCMQHDQTDLQWLDRLCEEEGIHYHFEHSSEGHLLVFAENTQSFAEHPGPLAWGLEQPAAADLISELHFRFEVRADLDFYGEPRPCWTAHEDWQAQALSDPSEAANQTFSRWIDTPPPPWNPRYEHQRRSRDFERQRCMARQLLVSSNCASLHCGETRRIVGHPRETLNDRWLVTEIEHQGGHPFEAFISPVAERLDPLTGKHTAEGYSNQFKAIPWATTFRPAIRNVASRPCGYQIGTVLGVQGQTVQANDSGSLHIRLEGTYQVPGRPAGCRIPMGIHASGRVAVGTRALIDFIDNDPDRPLICGFLMNHQTIRGHCDTPVASPAQLLPAPLLPSGPELQAVPSATGPAVPKLHLFEYSTGAPLGLPHRNWYLLRLSCSDPQANQRPHRDEVLIEGKSDAQGTLGLTTVQHRQLAQALRDTPDRLWLLYPGQYLPLLDYLKLHFSGEQQRLFVQYGLEAPGRPNLRPVDPS